MKNKLLLLISILFATGLFFQSCEEDDDTPQIGISLKPQINDWRKALRYYSGTNLNNLGITYTYTGVDGNTTQGQIIRSMVEIKGCEVLIISPDELTPEEVQVVTAQNIPVVFLEYAVGNGYKSLVRTDNTEVGAKAGSYMNNLVNSLQIDSIAFYNITASDSLANYNRHNGFFSTIQDPTIVTTSPKRQATFTAGKEFGKSILANSPTIEAIYAQDDEVALGILEAIDEEQDPLKKLQIKAIIGCGGSQLFLNEIAGRQDIHLATTLYSPAMMEKCVEVATDILHGNEVEAEYLFQTEIIDATNVDGYFNLYAPY